MAGWPLRTVLIRRWMRFWIADLWSESIAPLTDANARLNYTAVATLMFLLLPRRSEERLLGQAVSLPEAAEAILYAFPAFLMLNAVFAIFRVSRAGRQLGTWFGPKYVYNEPKQVATLLVDASRQGQPTH